jgi:putative ABC transport system ATP-binding protein
MSMLEMRGVSKMYGEGPTEVRAISDIDLTVEAGALVAVMGASGSGKSTLLTIAGSLESPTRGDVHVDGMNLSKMSRNGQARMRRRTIGYVFQDFNLLPGLSAVENVSLPLELDGTGPRKAQSAAMAALEELGLADRAAHFPDQLSGGERQRVAIARALANEPTLVLADEPTGNLDSAATDDVLRLFAQMHANGQTLVIVTHDERIAATADRLITMRDGAFVHETTLTGGTSRPLPSITGLED